LMNRPGRGIPRHSPEIQTAVNAEWIDVETDHTRGSKMVCCIGEESAAAADVYKRPFSEVWQSEEIL
ncbi:MAG: hypothetical protein QG577_1285, partial [Thermodesulfobacteriota bacterium]|nr:hypothetical protein [Thermodesulfobacteriota bacterium]